MKLVTSIIFALILALAASLAQTPDIIWSYDLKDISYGNASADDIDGDGKLEIVFSTYFNDGHIYALNSEDGSELWKYDVGGCSDAAPIIFDVDGDNQKEIILHSSSVQKMFCFNGADGSIKWQINSNSTDSPPSIADIDGDGTPEIIDGDFAGNVICYNGEDGSVVWTIKITSDGTIQTAPVLEDLDGDGELDIVVATWIQDQQNKIVALKAVDGSLLWTFDYPQSMIYHGPAIVDLDGDNKMEVLTGSYDENFYCLNGATGESLWTKNYPNYGYIYSPTTVGDINGDGRYEITFFSGSQLVALNYDGSSLWSYQMQEWTSAFRGTILADISGDGKLDVIFGNSLGEIIALDGNAGEEIFKYDMSAVYGSLTDASYGILVADFNGDGPLDLFFVVGHVEYPEVENDYGRAYLITAGVGAGPDWLMFHRNVSRNSVIPITPDGVEELNAATEDFFTISPNPGSDFIVLNLDGVILSEAKELKIYNAFGECVLTVGVELALTQDFGAHQAMPLRQRIDISEFPIGFYFIQIGNYTEKFMVVR